MSDSQMFFVGQKRGRGRPRLYQEPTSPISTRVPVSRHDQLVKLAQQRRISVSELVSSLVCVGLKRQESK